MSQWQGNPPFEQTAKTHPPQPDLPDPGEFTNELVAGPTGWQSIPHAVRFAVWLWAVAVIFSFVAGILAGVVFLFGLAAR